MNYEAIPVHEWGPGEILDAIAAVGDE
jgi:hypothetical protein